VAASEAGHKKPAGEREEATVDRSAETRGWEMVRKAMDEPEASYLPADRVRQEVRRLQTRLAQVRSHGGSYRDVELSESVRELLARLEAGATLSTYVH